MDVLRLTWLPAGLALMMACGESTGGLELELQLTSVATIIERLEAAGTDVEVVGPLVDSFYPTADATQLRLDGEDLSLFEYATEAEALENSTSRPLVAWAQPPHFYLSGRFIALYVGTTGRLLEALKQVFGEEMP